ncbi:hypothetical protein [Microbacterium sp. A93]|uniref:hypothetical protein n=1 Tax=Microbacterium sp. A93 TaxID=3450716 RepID=UPI003F4378C1
MTVSYGRGSELEIEDAFTRYLKADGWEVRRQVGYVDVVATKGGRTLKAEVKGRTGHSQGLDSDTMFGQILRRFPKQPDEDFSAAVVVPAESVATVHRIPSWVLSRLGIAVYTVDTKGPVETVATNW